MSETTDRPTDPAGDDPAEIDLGEPLAELAELAWPPGDEFGRKVQGRIERRLLTGRLLDVAWSGPLLVFVEYLRGSLQVFSGHRRSH